MCIGNLKSNDVGDEPAKISVEEQVRITTIYAIEHDVVAGQVKDKIVEHIGDAKGVTVLLCGMAIALLGYLCHSPSVMLATFIATPIELSCWDGLSRHPLSWSYST